MLHMCVGEPGHMAKCLKIATYYQIKKIIQVNAVEGIAQRVGMGECAYLTYTIVSVKFSKNRSIPRLSQLLLLAPEAPRELGISRWTLCMTSYANSNSESLMTRWIWKTNLSSWSGRLVAAGDTVPLVDIASAGIVITRFHYWTKLSQRKETLYITSSCIGWDVVYP